MARYGKITALGDVTAPSIVVAGLEIARIVELASAPEPTTAGHKGDFGEFEAYAYWWKEDAVVRRISMETTW